MIDPTSIVVDADARGIFCPNRAMFASPIPSRQAAPRRAQRFHRTAMPSGARATGLSLGWTRMYANVYSSVRSWRRQVRLRRTHAWRRRRLNGDRLRRLRRRLAKLRLQRRLRRLRHAEVRMRHAWRGHLLLRAALADLTAERQVARAHLRAAQGAPAVHHDLAVAGLVARRKAARNLALRILADSPGRAGRHRRRRWPTAAGVVVERVALRVATRFVRRGHESLLVLLRWRMP